jgi:hypothetical protein
MAKTKTITKIQFRRGTDEDRKKITLADGEPGWVTDSTERALYIGDGVTKGGIKIFTEGTANISSGSTGSMAYYDGVTSISDAHWIYTDYNNGSPVLNIGHGTTANTTSLKINGTLKIPTNAVDGYVLTSNPTGDCYWAAAAGGSGGGQWSTVTAGINYTETGKNVGIGTSTPTKKLEVVGAIKASAGLWASALNLETKNTVTGTVTGGFNVYGSGGYLGVELRGTSNGSYIDFANDLTTDFDARIAHMGSTAVAGVSSALAIRGTSLVPGAVKVGINTETPNCDLTVNGCISASGTIYGVGASTKTLLNTQIDVIAWWGVIDNLLDQTIPIVAGNTSVTIPTGYGPGGSSIIDMSGIPGDATEVCIAASYYIDDFSGSPSNAFLWWEYRHGSSDDWKTMIGNKVARGEYNSNNSSGSLWIPLDGSGQLNFRLHSNGLPTTSVDALSLKILGYAQRTAPAASSGGSATLGTKQDLSGNQYADFTGIPDSATQINIMVIGADISSNLDWYSIFCQIGDSGGLETTSYTSESWNSTAAASFHGLEKYRTNDTGFQVNTNLGNNATDKTTGIMCIRLQDAVTNTWIAEWRFTQSNSSASTPQYPVTGAGWKSLSGPLDRLRIALLPENHTSPAANMGVFSVGTVNISYI